MTRSTLERRAHYDAKPREQRLAVTSLEVRDSDATGGLTFTGYASVTGSAYTVSDWLGEYNETIAAGAFRKSLDERDDVRLLVNHEGIPVARTKSGTLDLREITDPNDDPQGMNQTGLWCEASLDGDSPLVQTIRSAMSRGDLDQMSFAFSATRQEWNEDYTERTIRECKLFDVSVVTYPANPATSAALRSAKAVEAKLREGRALDTEDVNMLTQALGWLSSIDTIVDAGQDALAAYLGVANPDDDEAAGQADEGAERSAALRLARARAGLPTAV